MILPLRVLGKFWRNAMSFGATAGPRRWRAWPSNSLRSASLGSTPFLRATNAREIDDVFASLVQARAGGLVIGPDPFFISRTEQLVALTVRHAMPTIYNRDFAAAGGLISYGASLTDAYRLAGVYTGRVLAGAKPADLPVQQSTRVELVLNLKMAKTLGITFPTALLVRADEVIE